MVVDETTGHSKCDSCKNGTHNPNPVKFHKCPCKPHLEPTDELQGAPGTCSPCSEGYYKESGMRHDAACKKCPHPRTYSHDGAKRCCRSPCVVDYVLELMILCRVEDCWEPLRTGLVAQAREGLRNKANALINYQSAQRVKKLKNWWIGLTDYLKASASDTWQNVDEMFAQFGREGCVIPAFDFDAGTQKGCASLLFASLCYLQSHRCKFFWFFCRDVQKFEEPDDPNKCPYETKELYLEHFRAQAEWIEWRAAPLEERRRLARQIAKRFHPDKYVVNTSSCRHCIFVPIFLYSI